MRLSAACAAAVLLAALALPAPAPAAALIALPPLVPMQVGPAAAAVAGTAVSDADTRRTTLALMVDAADPTLAHPAIAAPFVMLGEGR